MTDGVTHLYLLVFPEKGVFKIGKADDIQNRIDTLRRWWGEVDYAASYYLPMDSGSVYRLEKSLHFLLSSRAVEFDYGDGRTELFALDALEQALKHVELYLALNTEAPSLQKGISTPIRKEQLQQRARPAKHERIAKGAQGLIASLAGCNTQLEKILRLIVLLMRYQSRIQFQYDIVDQIIYLRLRQGISASSAWHLGLLNLCTFRLNDLDGTFFYTALIGATGSDNVVQYTFELKKQRETQSAIAHPYFAYLSSRIELAMQRLPRRSSAALQDIPIIDMHRAHGESKG